MIKESNPVIVAIIIIILAFFLLVFLGSLQSSGRAERPEEVQLHEFDYYP